MRLTKHHGLGNDFLVFVDLDGEHRVDGAEAAAACDRHRGVGADGFIRVTRSGDDRFRMEPHNEDGSRAEISGNGICCLAQALVRAGHVTGDPNRGNAVHVDTDAGPRTIEVVEQLSATEHRMRVAMGTPKVGAALEEWVDDRVLRAVEVDVGNPHVVLHVSDTDNAPDLVELGRRIDGSTPGGANVELVTAGAAGELTMTVYERGVGPTQACGSGAVASAAAAVEWGLAPSTVTVHQPGGPAVVELGDEARLTVPVVAIAEVVWPL